MDGVGEEDEVLIADRVDVYERGRWSELERDLFTREEGEGLKEVLGEVYLGNEEELGNGRVSGGYGGYEIEGKKGVGVVKGGE
ncbi:hypothetical protein, partial [Paenibacillus xylanexedens]|uniref:hypothetical protein n=1 Tax=Paenibacillus xylanexedens TaxID=528191 RepID=UPI001C9305BF